MKKVPNTKDDQDEDDPIAKSLKEREAAGGLSETTKQRPGTAIKGPSNIKSTNDKTTENKSRPQTSKVPATEEKKVAEEKKTASTKTPITSTPAGPKIKPVAANVKEDLSDDPIAQSLAQR